ncbi:hypothetical protein BH23GEM9_BH23GEM9_08510 [soil metagenome]
MSTPYSWTYSEYARFPDDGSRYEVIDGEVMVTPAPSTGHQHVLLNLAFPCARTFSNGESAGC